jgi:hypothetical protein
MGDDDVTRAHVGLEECEVLHMGVVHPRHKVGDQLEVVQGAAV